MKKRQFIYIINILFLLGLLKTNICAEDTQTSINDFKYIYTVPDSVVDLEINKEKNRLISEMNMTRRIPEYAEYQDRLKGSTTVKPSSPQKVGNQLPGGVRLETGGELYWSPDGGPSVSVGLGASFYGLSVDISIGTKSSSNLGYSVQVPNTTNYFHLYALPEYKVSVYEVWGRRVGQTEFEYLYTVTPKTYYRVSLSARIVG